MKTMAEKRLQEVVDAIPSLLAAAQHLERAAETAVAYNNPSGANNLNKHATKLRKIANVVSGGRADAFTSRSAPQKVIKGSKLERKFGDAQT